jgi:molybdenum cofactor cytidylyltransferase
MVFKVLLIKVFIFSVITDIHAVLLAAGTSERMPGRNKLLLPWHGQLLICHVVHELVQSPVSKLTVVMNPGSNFSEVLTSDPKLILVKNTKYETGMGSSLHTGLNTITGNPAGIMICLADMPLLTKKIYSSIIEAFLKLGAGHPRILVPTFQGTMGNPVIFSYDLLNELLSLPSDRDRGAKDLVKNKSQWVTELPLKTNAVLMDVDNWDDYMKNV